MAEHCTPLPLRSVRERSGVSLRSLAAQIGVSPATLSAIETGRTPLTVDRLRQLARALSVPVAALLEEDEAMRRAEERPAVPIVAGEEWRTFGPLQVDPILLSAVAAFVRVGYHAATVREIAAAGGRSIAGLYHHYPTKQHLLIAALDLTMSDLRWRVLSARAQGRGAEERFSLMVEALALFHVQRADLAFLGSSEMRSLVAPERARIARLRNEIQGFLDEDVATAVLEGTFRTSSPRDAARAVATMCTSLPSWFRADGLTTPAQIAGEYAEFALALMREERSSSLR